MVSESGVHDCTCNKYKALKHDTTITNDSLWLETRK